MKQYLVLVLCAILVFTGCKTNRIKIDHKEKPIYDFSELKGMLDKHWRKDKDKNIYYTKNKHYNDIVRSISTINLLDSTRIIYLLGPPSYSNGNRIIYDIIITDAEIGKPFKFSNGSIVTIKNNKVFISITLSQIEFKSNGTKVIELAY